MNRATKKWVFLKASSVVLIPLMAWFIINLVSIFDKDYFDVLTFFSTQSSRILFSLLLIFDTIQTYLTTIKFSITLYSLFFMFNFNP